MRNLRVGAESVLTERLNILKSRFGRNELPTLDNRSFGVEDDTVHIKQYSFKLHTSLLSMYQMGTVLKWYMVPFENRPRMEHNSNCSQDLTCILHAVSLGSLDTLELIRDAERLPLMHAECVIRQNLHPLHGLQ